MARPIDRGSANPFHLLARECGVWLAERMKYGRGLLPIMLLRQGLGAKEEERKVIVRRNRLASILRCWVSLSKPLYMHRMNKR